MAEISSVERVREYLKAKKFAEKIGLEVSLSTDNKIYVHRGDRKFIACTSVGDFTSAILGIEFYIGHLEYSCNNENDQAV